MLHSAVMEVFFSSSLEWIQLIFRVERFPTKSRSLDYQVNHRGISPEWKLPDVDFRVIAKTCLSFVVCKQTKPVLGIFVSRSGQPGGKMWKLRLSFFAQSGRFAFVLTASEFRFVWSQWRRSADLKLRHRETFIIDRVTITRSARSAPSARYFKGADEWKLLACRCQSMTCQIISSGGSLESGVNEVWKFSTRNYVNWRRC